jgi:hypothetical protein
LLKTRRFGVNNERWSNFPSLFGDPWWKIIKNILTIYPLIDNYRAAKFRAKIGFLHPDTVEKLGWK